MSDDAKLKKLREDGGDEDFEDLEENVDLDLDKALKNESITPDANDEDGDATPHPLNSAGDINKREKEE